jgi:hypothetical protein
MSCQIRGQTDILAERHTEKHRDDETERQKNKYIIYQTERSCQADKRSNRRTDRGA